jgi:hypothetical protein
MRKHEKWRDYLASIRDELEKCARSGGLTYYKELGGKVGLNAQSTVWKPALDEISKQQALQNLPDITFLVRRKDTGLPGQIGFNKAEKPTPEQVKFARGKLQEVWDKYCPGAHNPY